MQETDDLLTIEQAAVLVGSSTRYIERMIKDGLFPEPYRMSRRRVRHSRRAILKWLESTRHRDAQKI